MEVVQRLRARLSKAEEARFISHLDFMRTLERALRRASIPVAYSQGFNPHPRFSLAPALAVGVTSSAEYGDFELRARVSPEAFARRLNEVLPAGLRVEEVREIAPGSPPLAAEINVASYLVDLETGELISPEEGEKELADFLGGERIPVSRGTKRGVREIDLRPLILGAELLESEGRRLRLRLRLRTGSQGSARPEEVVQAWQRLSPRLGEARITRIHREGLYVEKRGRLYPPIQA